MPTKVQVVQAVRAQLQRDVDTLERLHGAATSEVSSDETRQEGKYDTRATEASYLARGQAQRHAEIKSLLAWFERFDPTWPPEDEAATVGSLVTLGGPTRRILFIAPQGGPTVELEGERITVASDASVGRRHCGRVS